MNVQEKAAALDAILEALEATEKDGQEWSWPIYRDDPAGEAILAAGVKRKRWLESLEAPPGREAVSDKESRVFDRWRGLIDAGAKEIFVTHDEMTILKASVQDSRNSSWLYSLQSLHARSLCEPPVNVDLFFEGVPIVVKDEGP